MKENQLFHKNFVLLFILLTCSFLLTCNTPTSDHNNKNDTIQNNNSSIKSYNIVYTKYKIPLTIDIFDFLKKHGTFEINVINPISNKDDYLTVISKAINLGIYTSDLAYCNIFSQGQLSVEYFDLTSKFANHLHIKDGYDKKFIDRIQKNTNDRDSLTSIANESYWKACNYLEANGNNNILPFIVFGGWIESLYIILFSENDNISDIMIRDYIINQKVGLNNLINYLYDVQIESTAFYFNKDLKIIIKELETLKILYEKYDFKENKPEIYKKIVTNIKEIRNKYTD